jgi:purine-binding chemotaxis protein CheW
MDLRNLLGEPWRPDEPDTRFVVLLVDHDGRKLHIALRVDRVIEVATLDGTSSSPWLEQTLQWDEAWSRASTPNGSFVAVLRSTALGAARRPCQAGSGQGSAFDMEAA